MRETSPKRRIVVAVTGASGSLYARLLCGRLAASEAVDEIALIVTGNGRRVAAYEDRTDWMDDPRYTLYDDGDLFGAPASGSARYDAMAVVPCSMGMAGRIASGVSDSLASPCGGRNAQGASAAGACHARGSARHGSPAQHDCRRNAAR